MKWCRRCRKWFQIDSFYKYKSRKDGRDNYCKGCREALKCGADFNRYRDKETFAKLSFIDVVEGPWNGFDDNAIRLDSLPQQLEAKFTGLLFLTSFEETNFPTSINNDDGKLVYLCIGYDKTILKVGQTTNWKSRFHHYYNLHPFRPLSFDIFTTPSWELQDLLAAKVRNYLEFLGHKLLQDRTDKRLEHIH